MCRVPAATLRFSSRNGFRALVRAHDLDQVMLCYGIARFAAENVFQSRLRTAFIMQPHEICLRVADAPARKGIDVNVSLVPRRDRNRRAVPFEETFVDAVDFLDERKFEVQTGIGDRSPDRFAELREDHLFRLMNRVKSSRRIHAGAQDAADNNRSLQGSRVLFISPHGFSRSSGNIGSKLRIESSMMILVPIAAARPPSFRDKAASA